jgi:hypothetical protein
MAKLFFYTNILGQWKWTISNCYFEAQLTRPYTLKNEFDNFFCQNRGFHGDYVNHTVRLRHTRVRETCNHIHLISNVILRIFLMFFILIQDSLCCNIFFWRILCCNIDLNWSGETQFLNLDCKFTLF